MDIISLFVGVLLKIIVSKFSVAIINNFPWPKSQKWGSGSLKWIRPLKNITVLYDGKIVKCKIGDENLYLQSTNFTFGHSFLKKEKIFFRSHIDYVNNLKKGLVLVDPYIRKNEISRVFCHIETHLITLVFFE